MSTETDIHDAARAATAGELDLEALSAAVGERAADEGILDLAYARMDSPLGELLAVSTPDGLVHLGYPNRPLDAQLEGLAQRISPRIVESPRRLDEVRSELDEYFEGRRRRFDLALDWQLTGGFVRAVLERTASIPFGETRTYGEVAAAAGSPRAFRAAGSALGANPIPIVVPCHRVLRSGGALGGYGGGLDAKRELLELEGVM
ncbi:MAG TPA: methylated-DNA--[protein]-cysteine S-methyltransferase [Solirubrobacterales bacterium]|nr:methylated-DNA--[protein]-cysteine S-methyltransferase [Solirubrobacterales bacterium]